MIVEKKPINNAVNKPRASSNVQFRFPQALITSPASLVTSIDCGVTAINDAKAINPPANGGVRYTFDS